MFRAGLAAPVSDLPGAETGSRFGNLDLLRFCAALFVALYHYTYVGPASVGLTPTAFPELLSVTQHRWAGAWFFFMVSGFSISYVAQRGSALRFLTARFARIFPIFVLCMSITSLVMLAAAPMHVAEFEMSWTRWLANLTLVPRIAGHTFVDGVYWSLTVEIVFYLCVGGLMSLGVFKRYQLAFLAIWLGVSCLNEFWLEQGVLGKLLTRNSCFFAMGMLSFRVFEAQRRPHIGEIILALMAVALAVKADHNVNGWLRANLQHAADWSFAYALLKTLVALVLLNLAVRFAPLVNARTCKAIGGLCFPFYLLHSNIGFVLFHHLDGVANRWLALALVFTVVLALAYGISRFFDPKARAAVTSGVEWFGHWLASLKQTRGSTGHLAQVQDHDVLGPKTVALPN
jgi:peptidoglycan/LPS O-acetylase OafA/YrhL